jgi:membrane protein
MKQTIGKSWKFISEVFSAWNDDDCFRLSAALSYYTLFSIAPLLVVLIATTGYFFGEQATFSVHGYLIRIILAGDRLFTRHF